MREDIMPVNHDGNRHGYWKRYYHLTDTIAYEGLYVDGWCVGYWNEVNINQQHYYIRA